LYQKSGIPTAKLKKKQSENGKFKDEVETTKDLKLV